MKRRRRFEDLRFSTKLIVLFAVGVVLPLAVGTAWTFRFLDRETPRQIQTVQQHTLNQVGRNLDRIFEQLLNYTNLLALSTDVRNLVLTDMAAVPDFEKYRLVSAVIEVFSSVASSFVTEPTYVVVAGLDGTAFASWQFQGQRLQSLQDQPWFPDPDEAILERIYRLGVIDSFVESERVGDLFAVLRLIGVPGQRSPVGYVVVATPVSVIQSALSFDAGAVASRRWIETPDENIVATVTTTGPIAGDEPVISNSFALRFGGYTLREVTRSRDVLADVRSAQRRLLLVMGGVIVGFVAIAALLSLSMSRRLRELGLAAESVQRNRLDVVIDSDAHDEIGLLARAFHDMIERIRALVSEVYHEQDERRRLELKVLQNQINPHFLFNALHSIQTMASLSRAPNVAQMIGALSNILMQAVRNPQELVTLRTELEIVSSFAMIQKMRQGDLFELSVDVADALLDTLVPKFILQPIVENSIQHGLKDLNRRGTIDIAAEQTADRVHVSVRDNGRGFPVDAPADPEHFAATGEAIGLSNVHRRLALTFGDGYGIRVVSNGSGASVVLIVPTTADTGDGAVGVQ
ncbi:MAG: sensor histidine kinase [Spirochaetaceae bacterium]|nr:MAG: sensor histidine kinase [Spirochaetaceae bacterium]